MAFHQRRTTSISDPPPPYQYTTVDDDQQSDSSRRSFESATGDIAHDAPQSSGAGAQQSKDGGKETIELRPMLEGQPATFKRPKDLEKAQRPSRRLASFFAGWRRALLIILAATILLLLAVAVAVPVIVLKRHHSTSSNATAISPTEYLGGFDAISENGLDIIYTDQNKNLQLAYSNPYSVNNGWYRAKSPIVAGNVKPGSPVSIAAIAHGSYVGQVHVFYVGQNGTVLGLYTSPPFASSGGWTNLWFSSPINSLNLKVSDSMFVRSCTATDSYQYPQSPADIYLYYGSTGGSIQKYAMWSNSTEGPTWQAQNDLPPIQSARGLSCQISNGIETLWIVNTAGVIEQWWRGQDTPWTKGFQGSDKVFVNSTLLTVTDTSQNMTHLFFQDASLNLRRYDLTGYAQDIRLDAESTSFSGTPGTRLAIWPDSEYCEDGECMTLLYQRFNTSDVHYSSFSDNCLSPASDCPTTTKASTDSIIPLLQTYGRNVKRIHLSNGAIAGIVIGFCCFLLLCHFGRRRYFPNWKPGLKLWTRV